MKHFFSIIPLIALMMTQNLNAQKTVPNDPLNAKIYTLDNGLKLYISVNKKEPKIQTLIAVKAGSKFDPADNTGLAHYLEHLMFKGTDKIGTLDWEKEKVYLDS
ncbi:MAG: insulinase family protein, partial [Chitinophagales bacterium]|nr:insulinase family protein [Chitinophagales bacterium]